MSNRRNNINVKVIKDTITQQVTAELETIDDIEVLKEKRDELNQQTKRLGQERRQIEDERRSNRERAFKATGGQPCLGIDWVERRP